jgi:hypothetical protein
MRRHRYTLIAAVLAGALAADLGLRPDPASAGCNVIPSATTARRGAIGTVDRPFSRAGGTAADLVRMGRACSSPALKDANGDGKIDEHDYVVTVIFTPPRNGPRNAVALTAAQDCSALSCGEAETPLHCVAGAAAGISVDTAAGTLGFRFPDTDPHLGSVGDGRTFTGPATVAVTPVGQPLPCELASKRCADLSGGPLFACVDELFGSAPGACGTGRADLDPTFGHFTALPPENNYQRMCNDAGSNLPPCLDKDDEFRFTVDQAGNLALPMSWTNILKNRAGSSKKDNRELRGSTPIRAVTGTEGAVAVPSQAFLASFTPVGTQFNVPPRFEPQKLTDRPRELVLIGEADEPESVLWVSRRKLWGLQCQTGAKANQACEKETAHQDCAGKACTPLASPLYFACAGGKRDGLPCTRTTHCAKGGGKCLPGTKCVTLSGQPTATSCTTDSDCAADQECGRGLFEFRDRLVSGAGPIVIPKPVQPGKEAVYRGGGNAGKKCTANSGSDRCVGYRAEARQYKPKAAR